MERALVESATVTIGIAIVIINVIQRRNSLATSVTYLIARIDTLVLTVIIHTAKVAYIVTDIIEYVLYLSVLLTTVALHITRIVIYVNDFLYKIAVTTASATRTFKIVNRLSFLATIIAECIAISLVPMVGDSCVITSVAGSITVVIKVMEEVSYITAQVTRIITLKIILVVYVCYSVTTTAFAVKITIGYIHMRCTSGNLITQITFIITLIGILVLVSAAAIVSALVTVFIILVIVNVVALTSLIAIATALAIVVISVCYCVGIFCTTFKAALAARSPELVINYSRSVITLITLCITAVVINVLEPRLRPTANTARRRARRLIHVLDRANVSALITIRVTRIVIGMLGRIRIDISAQNASGITSNDVVMLSLPRDAPLRNDYILKRKDCYKCALQHE